MAADYYQAWLDARAVVRAARDVASAWPADNTLSKQGTSIGYLRDAVTAYDQRNHDSAPPIAAPAPSAATPAAFHQQLGIDGSKFAMHGTVTSTTPPAAPAAVTRATGVVAAHWSLAELIAKDCEWSVPVAIAYLTRWAQKSPMLSAALAAAASAERGE